MLRPGVDRRQVERQAVEAPALQRRLGRGEVAVPGLVGGAGERDVEADLDDPVVGPEHRLAHGDEPGVRGDVDEAADPLRLDLDVEALRARAAGPRPATALASSNRAMTSPYMRSAHSGEKAPFRPMMPSP